MAKTPGCSNSLNSVTPCVACAWLRVNGNRNHGGAQLPNSDDDFGLLSPKLCTQCWGVGWGVKPCPAQKVEFCFSIFLSLGPLVFLFPHDGENTELWLHLNSELHAYSAGTCNEGELFPLIIQD